MSVLTRHSAPRAGAAPRYPSAPVEPEVARGGRLARSSSALNAVAGAWLLVSPLVLDYGTPRTTVVWNSAVIGVLVVVVACVKVARPHLQAVSWLNIGFGGWLVLSPWVLAERAGLVERSTGNLNMVVVGMVVLALAVASSAGTLLGGKRGARGR